MERNYNIFQSNQQKFLDRIAKLNKKAQKLGCDHIVATVVDSFYEAVDGKAVKYYVYDVQGLAPKLNGWSFVASIEVMKTGNLVKNIPDIAAADMKWHTESLSCEHCKVARRRKAFFILRNEEGEEISVGRSCLKDFLGHRNPQLIAAFMESMQELRGYSAPGEYEPEYHSIVTVLEVARACVRRKGFVSRKAVQESFGGKIATAELVETFFRKGFTSQEKEYLEEFRKEFAPVAADVENAQKVLGWISGLAGENDFEANLKLLAAEEYVTSRHFGFLAAAAFFGGDKEEKAPKSNEWIGTVGERVTLNLKVVDTREVETGYGISHLITFEDETGNAIKWFSSRIQDLEIDANVTVMGRIKDHSDWKGRKQTMLTRCTLTVQETLEKAC